MDKKSLISRPRVVQQIRPRANLPSGSFIALGGRPNTPETGSATVIQSAGIKREGVPIIAPSKKPRLVGRDVAEGRQSASPISSTLGAAAVGKRDISSVDSIFQGAVTDVNPTTFWNRMQAAEEKGRTDKVEKLLLGLVKFMYENRMKPPDPTLAANLCLMARDKGHYFKDIIIEGLCASLRKYVGVKATLKCHPLTYQLVCATLYRALNNREDWPETLVKAYLDDALSDRAWVDRKECNQLVQNILTAFGTEQPPSEFFAYLYYGEGSRASVDRGGGGSPVHASSSPLYEDDSRSRDATDVGGLSLKFEEEPNAMETSASNPGAGTTSSLQTPPRFIKNSESIRNYAIDLLRDWWSRRLDAVPKGLLKTMAVCCGYPEVRLAAAQKLDAWLQNAKLQRVATELMMYVCINFQESTDMETLSCLTRLRFKSRLVANNYCYVLKELFSRVPTSLSIVLKLVVHNELSSSTTRAAHNMLVIGECFKFDSDLSCQTLANICFEILSTKEDLLRTLRVFLREVVKSALKFDFPMNAFCRALIQERDIVATLESAQRERIFHSLEDLICLTAFLGISPSVRDAALALAGGRGDRRDVIALTTFQRNLVELQSDVVSWLQNVAPALFRPAKDDYVRVFYRITLLEKSEFYSSKDGWPTDQERNLFLKIISEAGVSEDLLLRILTVGLSSENQLSPSAALDITEQLVKRAALAVFDPRYTIVDQNALKISNFSIIDLLFNCCRYRPPEQYQLPTNYVLPMLAITALFWKAVTVLVILAACNSSIGRIIWENYPTLQYIMEMAISGDFVFPPSTVITGQLTADDIKRQDLQIAELEKQEILELEGYLATGVVITETNSSLLAHLMRLDLKGPARRPPPMIMDGLKQLNQQLNLGLAFCRSRDPDFLLEIIGRQGSSHSLPWLIQLIQKNEGSLGFLPVQCLCEFLLHHLEKEKALAEEIGDGLSEKASTKITEFQNSKQLRQRLIEVVWSQSEDSVQTEQTLLYFFSRLQADTAHDRSVAAYALELLLEVPEEMRSNLPQDSNQNQLNDFQWLLGGFPLIPHFSVIRGKVVDVLAKCTTVETDLRLLRAYIAFLHQHITDQELDDVALNLGKLVYGRRFLTDRLLDESMFTDAPQTLARLFDIFDRHLTQVRSAHSDVIRWSASQDQLLIHWGDTALATLYVNVVAATYLLLGYPRPEGSTSYDRLMESWFPSDQSRLEAFMIDTSEPAELIPEDVKFQLLRSKNDFIVDSVLESMDDRQLLTCITYCGLPASTVSKVCSKLDTRVVNNTDLLNEMRTSAETWLEFLSSHAIRGALVGDRFIDWCRTTAAIEVK